MTLDDGLVDLCLEGPEEAGLAQRVTRLGPLEYGLQAAACLTQHRHGYTLLNISGICNTEHLKD